MGAGWPVLAQTMLITLASFHYQDPGNSHLFPQEIKGPYAASSRDRKRSRGRVPTARVTRGGSCGKVGEVGGPIYAEIEYI